MIMKASTQNTHRTFYFDNIKFILITLVVIGHSIEGSIGLSSNIKLVYNIIYSFHMPLFVFISGYFSKNIKNDEKLLSRVTKTFIYYIVLQFLYCIFNIYILGDKSFQITFVNPYWLTWYLLSFGTWLLIMPYIPRPKYSIPAAFIISILTGYDSNVGYYLSLSRTITFFPYFLMGYFCKKEHILSVKNKIKKQHALLGLLVIFLIIYITNNKVDYRWLYGSYPYSQLSSPGYPKFIIRLLLYIVSTAESFFVMILVPKKSFIFTKIGSQTIWIYGLHGFIIKLMGKYTLPDYINSFWGEILIAVIPMSIILFLSSKLINKIAAEVHQIKFKNEWGTK